MIQAFMELFQPLLIWMATHQRTFLLLLLKQMQIMKLEEKARVEDLLMDVLYGQMQMHNQMHKQEWRQVILK